jgi:hypothetical protein
MNKKELGAFYTTNADNILSKFKNLVKGKKVIDPFCGEKDLLKWSEKNGAVKTFGCDINQNVNPDININSIMHPLDYSHYDIVVTNPPYLLNNKTKNKAPFIMWDVKDLYKASLLSIAKTANELIAIIPSNFIFDSDNKFRNKFFSMMEIKAIECFDEAVFNDTTTRVCIIHAVKGITTHINGYELYNTKIGKNWYKLIERGKNDVKRLTQNNTDGFISNICVSTTDTGSDGGEIRAYIGEPFYGKHSDRNLFTAVFEKELTKKEQEYIVSEFNRLLNKYRVQYDSMFLTNFLAGKNGTMRKRISFKDALSLISVIKSEIEK